MKTNNNRHLTSAQIIIMGFIMVILAGTFVLMLPVSSREGIVTPFFDALFTATSAVCVTGLVVYDTVTHWSAFGQIIILILIQIGGMGVITVTVTLAILARKKISLKQRSTMQEAISAPKVGGIVRLTGFIVKGTLLIELLGAAIMAPVFCGRYGIKGIWMSLFHSVSAFCNAGFDLMGMEGPFSSLTSYSAQPLINIVIMLLVVVGGIGFITWDDVCTHGIHFRRYRMQSKVALTTTLLLLVLPAVYFYFIEFTTLPTGERILGSMFQSVTARTAGFNTLDLNQISEGGQTIFIVLMLIGGSPGSTAGGMKTTTLAVLCGVAIATARRKEHAHFFDRRIEDGIVKHATTILIMYLALFVTGGVAISIIENMPVLPCLFETASAVGTVGVTLGITQQIGLISRMILVVLMFLGRVGGLTLIFAAVSGNRIVHSELPAENITVG